MTNKGQIRLFYESIKLRLANLPSGDANMTSFHEVQSICPYCAEGCGFYTIVEQGKVLNIEYMKKHPVNEGGLCLKGNAVLDIIYHPNRIYSPLAKKDDGTLNNISWDEAINVIVSNFQKIAKKYGPDSLAFLTSANCTNEENYLFQKLARIIGTNNVYCSSSYEGDLNIADLATSFGNACMTNPLSDIANAECILISGSNFTDNHPIVSHWIFEAKSKGGKIIYIDHRVPSSLLICDYFLQANPGTQALLIDGMITHILERHLYNEQFIEERTSGFEALKKAMCKQPLKLIEKISGIPAAKIKEVAEIYASSSASAIIHCTDFSPQHGNHKGTTNLANLALLCGHLGRPGTGIFPISEYNNVQGSYDMGVSPHLLPGQAGLKDDIQQKRIAKLWHVKKLPSKGGLPFPEIAKAIKRHRIKALYIMESNPLEEYAHADQLKAALKGLEFLLVQDLFLTETAKQADIVLPAVSWAEKTGTYTNTERRVQLQSRIINPQKQTIPNWQVISSIAEKLGFGKQFSFSNTEDILKEINKAIPAYTGMSATRVKRTEGLIWPCPTPKHPGTPILYAEHFDTPDGLGKFIPVFYEKKVEKPTKKYPFRLTFAKSPAFYNTPITSLDAEPPLPTSPELFVEINPRDANTIHIHNQSKVKISTKAGHLKATACITERVLPGVVFIPFFPASGDAKILSTIDPRVKFPELNAATCQIKGSGGKQSDQ